MRKLWIRLLHRATDRRASTRHVRVIHDRLIANARPSMDGDDEGGTIDNDHVWLRGRA